MRDFAPLLAACAVLGGCGGTVVFDEPGSSEGGAPATGSVGSVTGTAAVASGATATTASGAGGGSTTNTSTGAGGDATTSVSIGAGGAPFDGSCVAPDYCSCIEGPTCRVIAEDCFCSCDEPCSEPCDCDCSGGRFLMCAPGSIIDPGALDSGVWLVGWSGGLNHFSWLRFETDGRLFVFDGANIIGNEPYFPCNGVGSWTFADSAEGVRLELPAGCSATILSFGDWRPIEPMPPEALQSVFLFDGAAGVTLGGWRMPDATCTEDLSSCADPFSP